MSILKKVFFLLFKKKKIKERFAKIILHKPSEDFKGLSSLLRNLVVLKDLKEQALCYVSKDDDFIRKIDLAVSAIKAQFRKILITQIEEQRAKIISCKPSKGLSSSLENDLAVLKDLKQQALCYVSEDHDFIRKIDLAVLAIEAKLREISITQIKERFAKIISHKPSEGLSSLLENDLAVLKDLKQQALCYVYEKDDFIRKIDLAVSAIEVRLHVQKHKISITQIKERFAKIISHKPSEDLSSLLENDLAVLKDLKQQALCYVSEDDDFIRKIDLAVSAIEAKLREISITRIKERLEKAYQDRKNNSSGASDPAQR